MTKLSQEQQEYLQMSILVITTRFLPHIPEGLMKKNQFLKNFEMRETSNFNVDEFYTHLN